MYEYEFHRRTYIAMNNTPAKFQFQVFQFRFTGSVLRHLQIRWKLVFGETEVKFFSSRFWGSARDALIF
jgi:hypothetical protein